MRQIAQRITGRYHLEPLHEGRHARVRESPAARRRRAERHLHEIVRSTRSTSTRAAFRGSSTSSPTARCSPAYTRTAQRRHEARRRPRRPRCSEFAAGRRGGRSRRRRPALRPSCSASRTWARRRARPAAAPESFLAAPAPPPRPAADLAVDSTAGDSAAAAAAAPRARRRRADARADDARGAARRSALRVDDGRRNRRAARALGGALRSRARRAVRPGPGARPALPVPAPRHARRAAARQLADDSVARDARTASSIPSS